MIIATVVLHPGRRAEKRYALRFEVLPRVGDHLTVTTERGQTVYEVEAVEHSLLVRPSEARESGEAMVPVGVQVYARRAQRRLS